MYSCLFTLYRIPEPTIDIPAPTNSALVVASPIPISIEEDVAEMKASFIQLSVSHLIRLPVKLFFMSSIEGTTSFK
ncbi:hypothetical protein D3C85_1753070 [compost metagenome]